MRIKKSKTLFATIIIAGLLICSCKDDYTFKETKNIKGEWQIKDSVCFNVDMEKIENFYNIYFKIDVKKDFLTENLWLFVKSTSPSGNVLVDTVSYFICDKTGKWFGKEKGDKVINKFVYKAGIKFPEKGVYRFCIRHGMREKDLPRISEIGIEIENTDIKD